MATLQHADAGTEDGSTKKALLKLLRPGGALAEAGAVIVYATFQAQAEQLAHFLTSHGIRAAAYHAGKHMKVGHHALPFRVPEHLRQDPHLVHHDAGSLDLTDRDRWDWLLRMSRRAFLIQPGKLCFQRSCHNRAGPLTL